MSDYFSPLRTLEVDATPLPVEDVMRTGTRRRRTRQAGGMVASAVLVGAVVAGGLQLGDGAAQRESVPAGPSGGWIPEDFALGADLPVSSQQADVRGASEVPGDLAMPEVCGTRYVLAGNPVDRLAIQGTNQQFTGLRDLAVFGSEAEAGRAVDEQVARFEDCPTEGSSPRTRTTVTPVDLGDRAWRVTRSAVYDGFVSGVEVWFLVQRGPAVLVAAGYLEPEQLERVDAAVRELQARAVEPVVEALCEVRTVC